MRLRIRYLPILLLACGAGAVMAQASPPRADRDLPEAVRNAERETGGRVLRADRVPYGDREVNRVRVLTPEGRVRTLRDEPRGREAQSAREESRRPESRRGGGRDD